MADDLAQSLDTDRTPTVYNFSAGPAMLPAPVMQMVQEELLSWRGTGISVMEMGHRTQEFISIAEQSERDLRELLAIPDDFTVLFLQGGATSQFSMVPLNLTAAGDPVDFIHTGQWSGKALKEAQRYCTVNVAATSEDQKFRKIPDTSEWQLDPEARYIHVCDNETIHGVEFPTTPETGEVPLVADMTSNLLSKWIDFKRYGLVFAAAQKNLGPSGLTVVIVRSDWLGRARPDIPRLYDYARNAREQSMANTPPTFSWYVAALVLAWVKAEGGVEEMQRRAVARSSKLYRAIDDSSFYRNDVALSVRSRMNVPFSLADESLNPIFIEKARERGLVALAGHRSVGGMRASLYNAMPVAGVDHLIDFMADFERQYG